MEHSKMFKVLKDRWDRGYITEECLRGWVELHNGNPSKGITEEEFTEITGIPYR